MSSSTLSDFDFLGRLGRGSFGEVFKVRRHADGLLYVLKKIRLGDLSRSEQEAAIKEVHIMASLSSPHVVRYYDSFIDEESALCIVMELCDRGDLARTIKKTAAAGASLPEPRVWRIFLQITLGLAYLHARRTLHRDLKSANVFLCAEDVVKIGDLGVARVLGTESFYARTCVGTPYYLSPELIQGNPYNDRSDVWALGCILYELCTGRHAFDANNQGTLILKIIQGTYPAIPDSYSDLLASLVDALLTRDSSSRPSAMDILLEPDVYAKMEEYGIDVPSFVAAAWRSVQGLPPPEGEVAPPPPRAAAYAVSAPAAALSPVQEETSSSSATSVDADAMALEVYDRHMGGVGMRASTPRSAPTTPSQVTVVEASSSDAPRRLTDTVRVLQPARPPSVNTRANVAPPALPPTAVRGAAAPAVAAASSSSSSLVIAARGYIRGTRFRRGDPAAATAAAAGVKKRVFPLSIEATNAAAAAIARRRATASGVRSASRSTSSDAPPPAARTQSTPNRTPTLVGESLATRAASRGASVTESRAQAAEVAALPTLPTAAVGASGMLSPTVSHMSHDPVQRAAASGSSGTVSARAASMVSRAGSRPSLDLLKTVSTGALVTAAPAHVPLPRDESYEADFEPDEPAPASNASETYTVSTASGVGSVAVSDTVHAAPAGRGPPVMAWSADTVSDYAPSASPPHAGPDVDVGTDIDLWQLAAQLHDEQEQLQEHVARLRERCEAMMPLELVQSVVDSGGSAAASPMSVMDVSELSPDAYLELYRLEFAVGRLRDVNMQLLPFQAAADRSEA